MEINSTENKLETKQLSQQIPKTGKDTKQNISYHTTINNVKKKKKN